MNKEEVKWRRDPDAMQQYRLMVHEGLVQRALDMALTKNNPSRFSFESKVIADKIVQQSSMFDQMKGWNDCLNYLYSLAHPLLELPQGGDQDQYDPKYVEETYGKNYNS